MIPSMQSSKIETLQSWYELYFPPQSSEAGEGVDPSWEQMSCYVAVAATSLTVGHAWMRRPFSSIFSMGAGAISGVTVLLPGSFIRSYQFSSGMTEKGKALEEGKKRNDPYDSDRLRCWLERISSAAINPAVPNRTRIAWGVTLVPLVGGVAFVSPGRFFWWSSLWGTAALTDGACVVCWRIGSKDLQRQRDQTT